MAKLILPIDSADEHAKEIGRFMAHWALVERDLSEIMGALLRIDQFRSQILYKEFSALGVKFKLIRRLIYSYLDDTKERDALLKLIGDAQKISDIRNTYAHAAWAAGRDNTLTIIHGTPPAKPQERLKDFTAITAAEIRAGVQSIDALPLRLQKFRFDVLLTMAIRDEPAT